MQGSYSATYSTRCDKPVCTRATLWRQHYITTSKEYLTNSHILSIYFELAFRQLHLIKIACKSIIIWVNYERNKKGARFFETQCSLICSYRVDVRIWPAELWTAVRMQTRDWSISLQPRQHHSLKTALAFTYLHPIRRVAVTIFAVNNLVMQVNTTAI